MVPFLVGRQNQVRCQDPRKPFQLGVPRAVDLAAPVVRRSVEMFHHQNLMLVTVPLRVQKRAPVW